MRLHRERAEAFPIPSIWKYLELQVVTEGKRERFKKIPIRYEYARYAQHERLKVMNVESITEKLYRSILGLSYLVRIFLLILHRNLSLDSITSLFFGLGAYVFEHMVHLFQSPSACLWNKEILQCVSNCKLRSMRK